MSAENQKPLNSGFGRQSTVADVLENVDVAGKVAVVTGGYSGIGLEAVKGLTAAGAEVIVPARSKERADAALASAGIAAAVIEMDLADLASVYACAAEIGDSHNCVDILLNNAGIMACPEMRAGPGWELQLAVNHIGHFVFTRELMPYLLNGDGARVVSTSSVGHKRSDIRWDDMHFEKTPYDKWAAYGQSKTANALYALELNNRRGGDGVKAFSVHPGGIMTPLQRHLEREEMIALGWLNEKGEMSEQAKGLMKTPEQGAATMVWAATSPLLDGFGGEYCEDCDIAPLNHEAAPRWSHVMPWAVDNENAKRLWDAIEAMVLSALA